MTCSQQALLRKYGIRPVKRRGQNFLVDTNLARSIAQEVLAIGGCVLELGAGGGALTTHLLDGAERVVCIEVDRKLCALLTAEFAECPGFELIEGDLARLDWAGVLARTGSSPVVAGNLPYVLTSKVLFALAEFRQVVAGAVFMVQKEVAERMAARPGGKDYGILAVVLGSVFEIAVVRQVPATVFWPRPAVASAIIRLLPGPSWDDEEFHWFARTVKLMFGQRRKKLRTQLKFHFDLDSARVEAITAAAGVDPDDRPEAIDRAGFRRLAAALSVEAAS